MADEIFNDDELKALEEAEQQVETPAAEQTETASEQPRGPDGKFLPKEESADTKAEGTVPQGALHAERERRKGVEAELKKAKEQLDKIASLREQVRTREAPAPIETPPADDPSGLQHLTEKLTQIERTQHLTQQERDAAILQAQEDEHLGSIAAASDAAYREQVPDYDEAIKHLVQARAKELGYYGYGMPQIQRIIGEEARDIVRMAVQQNRDPADLAYQIALARGYRKATGEAQPGAAQKQIDAIGKAQSQSRSLGQAAGATPGELNGEAIASMSDDEFARLYDTKEGKALIDAIMEGRA